MKIGERTLALLTEALEGDETVRGLLYTDRLPSAFEQEQLVVRGCTFLSPPTATVSLVRFRARDINLIVNLDFVDAFELFEKYG